MTAAYYHSSELPWSPALAEERRFRHISVVTLTLFVLFCVMVASIKVPAPDRFEAESLPPRLAKLVLQEKPQPPPPPPAEPVKAEPEKKPEAPKPEAKPEPQPEPQPDKTETVPPIQVQAAREKAAQSGLLAMKNELAALRQNTFAALPSAKPLTQAGEHDTTRRSIITSTATSGSGGISVATLSRDPGQVKLAARDITVVESQTLQEEQKANPKRDGRKPGRSAEQIQLVLDQNKGAIYALYHRALRGNPALQGKVVLEITITPAGDVSECNVVSSELKDDDLVRKLVARVKLFQFGAKNVDNIVFTWPVDFLPSQ